VGLPDQVDLLALQDRQVLQAVLVLAGPLAPVVHQAHQDQVGQQVQQVLAVQQAAQARVVHQGQADLQVHLVQQGLRGVQE
jgi:hypothetical protein